MKKYIALMISAAIIMSFVSACGDDDVTEETGAEGSVYFLNFKPESEAAYKKVAESFTEETGIPINIVTAAAGTYEQKLTSEITKSEAPTIFQVNGPIGLESWEDYCMDLQGTDLYEMLSDKNLALKDGDEVYAVPYTVEGFGIIYNDSIMQKYFKMEDSVVESVDEIKNFDTFKAVVEDMTAKKDELGIEGVFASTSMASGEQWRWTSHLANVPFYYEFHDLGKELDPVTTALGSESVNFSYNEGFKNMFDLYINNSVTAPTLIGGKTTADSMSEFALGKAAMVQNGNWAMSQIAGVSGNTVTEDDVKMMPIYIGAEGEEDSGICVGTENYLAINDEASDADKQASLKFLEWLFSSETGKNYVLNDLGFISPFNTFEDDEKPADPLGSQVVEWISNKGVTSVPWVFTAFPSDEFKNRFGDALLQYAQGTGDWNNVVTAVTENWASEYALTR